MGGLTKSDLQSGIDLGQETVPEPDVVVAALGEETVAKPSPAQRRYMERGLDQPGGKLPLFDLNGKEIDKRTIRACIDHGWAEPWFPNPVKPDWVVCRLTDKGRDLLSG